MSIHSALRILPVLLPALLLSTPAVATEWVLNFQGQYFANGEIGYDLVEVDAILTTDDVQSENHAGLMGYRIRGLTGTRNGVAIQAVDTEDDIAFDGALGWPNSPFIRPDAGDWGLLPEFGFAFQTVDGNWYNLNGWGDFDGNNASERQLNPADPNGPFVVQIGVASATPLVASVPEPSSWAMMTLGIGLTGAMLRNRRRRFDTGEAIPAAA